MSRARTKQIEAGVEKEYERKGRSAAASKRIAGAVMGDIKRERAAKKSPAASEKNMLGQACTVEDHRPCELDTGVAFAKSISEEVGVPLPSKLQRIVDTGQGSETQIQAALEEWRYSIPKDRREEADWLYQHVFPGRTGR